MPASISKYLVHLAQDPDEMKRFSSSADSARQAMSAFGLSDDQQNALLSGDSKRVSDAVAAELPSAPGAQAILMTANLVAPSS